MAFIVGMLSQKGGAGKSTLTQLFARELAAGGYSVKIADLDTQQTTSADWAADRAAAGLEPVVRAEAFASVKDALRESHLFDAYILDGKPHASEQSVQIANAANLIVIPTRQSKADLRPAVSLAVDLADNHGVPARKIAFALNQTTDSTRDISSAHEFLGQTEFTVLNGFLPLSTGYSTAQDSGRALTETPYPSLNRRADELAQSIVNKLAALVSEEEPA